MSGQQNGPDDSVAYSVPTGTSESLNRRGAPAGNPPTVSFWRSIKMVGWSFLGIRKNSEYQQDMASVSLIHIVVVALGGVLVFVVSLMAFVNWVVAK